MNRIFSVSSVVLTVALTLTVATTASLAGTGGEVIGFDGWVKYEGKGSLRAAGFGTTKVEGKTEIILAGRGELQMTAGAKYRYRGESKWREAPNKKLTGAAGLRIRLERDEQAKMWGGGGIKVVTRAGGIGTVTLDGKGKVAVVSRYWRLLAGASDKVPASSTPGTLPPEDLK